MSLRTSDLEELVDCTSILKVTEKLAEIASEKADHIRASYSDEGLAELWDTLAARFLNDALFITDHKIARE